MSDYEIVKPDYDRSILSVSSSLLKHYELTHSYQSLPELDKVLDTQPKNVIFMILDCMGVNILKTHLAEDSFLRNSMVTEMTSVFPPTTTAATTAFYSELSPLESGWLGWKAYFKEYDEIIELFRNSAYYSGKKLEIPSISGSILKYESIYDRVAKQCADVEYSMIFPQFVEGGCKTFTEMCDRIAAQTQKSGRQLISAYWENPDYTIHRNGVYSEAVGDVMRNLNDELERVSKLMAKDTLLIISADHGAVDIEEIVLSDCKIAEYLRMPPCLEGRFSTFYVKDGCSEKFESEFRASYGDDFLLYTKREFIESGLLGRGTAHPKVDDFIGDFIAIGKTNKAFDFKTENHAQKNFKADHAGITKDEMMVPLLLWRN